MASVKILKKWYIPYAVRISFSHSEACRLTNPTVADSAAELSSILSGSWWIHIVVIAIRAQVADMRSKNETSGGYGIRVIFNFATGTITRISRRCFNRNRYPFFMRRFLPNRPCGPSPCP